MSVDSEYEVETSPITKKHNTYSLLQEKKRLRWPQTLSSVFLGTFCIYTDN